MQTHSCALAALALAAPTAFAQSAPPSSTTSTTTIVVTGNALRSEGGPPASVLGGDALARARSGTLGDTLAGLPGVAASGFGPQSSRPVIRGLDGDRIRLLDNGGAALDASSLSFDHAAAIDPLVVERFEVLRGPAALLYGGNATGGVVNAIDNRVPRTALGDLTGRAELRFGGAAAERAGAAVIEGGEGRQGGLNWHVDVAARKSRDQRVPRFTPIEDGTPGAPTTRVANSAGNSRAGAVGVSWADAAGFVGASIDSYRNHYGVTVEPDVTIRMRRERFALSGERRLGGAFGGVEFQASRTNYRHVEVEGDGAVGTTFTSRGHELRAMARLRSIALGAGTLHGVVGAQAESLDFAALGEEAFVPGTRTRSGALFALQEWRLPASLALAAGVRVERVRVASDGDAAGAAEPRFGAATERRFAPTSTSLGATLPLAAGWSATAQVGRTQRAPTYYELFANGVHVATGAFEVGDASLGLERSTHVELGTQWSAGTSQFKAQLFSTRFANYIALDATGRSVKGLPEYAFRAVPARLHGLEVEGRTRLAERPWTLDLASALDLVRGSRRATGEPLPRLAPLRARVGLEAAQGPWSATLTLRHLARQDRVPTPTCPHQRPAWSMRAWPGAGASMAAPRRWFFCAWTTSATGSPSTRRRCLLRASCRRCRGGRRRSGCAWGGDRAQGARRSRTQFVASSR